MPTVAAAAAVQSLLIQQNPTAKQSRNRIRFFQLAAAAGQQRLQWRPRCAARADLLSCLTVHAVSARNQHDQSQLRATAYRGVQDAAQHEQAIG
ncbi:hypothetical protein D9Q98_004177 [Chlorella vulgaris]|uniref:Uncharacterized protein n=1 Tax=Chlorella vulgaris TaxID=3077 RepID=A0A9D4TRT1_CHLVU|nr:hypothetical protein D9Q98_004177 [Chlorella vulgaris]